MTTFSLRGRVYRDWRTIESMSKVRKSTIEVQGTAITVISDQNEDFISLTDMLRAKDGEFFISDWLRNRNTV